MESAVEQPKQNNQHPSVQIWVPVSHELYSKLREIALVEKKHILDEVAPMLLELGVQAYNAQKGSNSEP